MQTGKERSNSLTEIDEIYLTGVKKDGYYKKESIHDFIVENPSASILVNIAPYPKLISAKKNEQKYVRSEPNDSEHDNLLKLPRE